MGLFDKLRNVFGSGGAGARSDEPEPNYRCLQCGTGYDRDHKVCSDCGSEFVAPIDPGADEEESEAADESA